LGFLRFSVALVGDALPQFIGVDVHADRLARQTDRFTGIGVFVAAIDEGSLVARRLAPYRMVLCAAPASVRRHSLAALQNAAVLALNSSISRVTCGLLYFNPFRYI